jgi:hypothetical protein
MFHLPFIRANIFISDLLFLADRGNVHDAYVVPVTLFNPSSGNETNNTWRVASFDIFAMLLYVYYNEYMYFLTLYNVLLQYDTCV